MSIDFNKPSTRLISPTKLAHVVLRTQPESFSQMKEFYKQFLGGHASHENKYISFITYDGEHHRIAISAVPGIGPRNPQTCGLAAVNHGVTLSIYYSDPNGNQIETQADCFASTEEATAYMRSREYAENPIGVDFDPDDLILKLQQGVSEESLLERPDIRPRGVETLPILNN